MNKCEVAQVRLAWIKVIEHWTRAATGTMKKDETIGPSSCALCEIFYHYPINCDGCPIKEHTQKQLCDGTPYDDIDDIVTAWDDDGRKRLYLFPTPEFKEVAEAFLEWLKDLRFQWEQDNAHIEESEEEHCKTSMP